MRSCFFCHEAVSPTTLTKCWDSDVRAWVLHDVCNCCRPIAEQIYQQQREVSFRITWNKEK